MPSKTSRVLGRAARWLAALLVLDVVASAGWLAAAVATERQDRDGEAIAVLWGDEGRLSAEGERRLNQALAVWRSGEPSRLIFCVGGTRAAQAFSGARVLCGRLAEAGIPVDRLRVGPGSNDTISNLSEIGELARSTRVRRVLVVSDPLQSMRIRLFLQNDAAPAELGWAPYGYAAAQPATGVGFLWVRVQHEFAAVGSLLIPGGLRRWLIDRLRS